MNFNTRSGSLELLDDPAIPFEDIRRNMRELDTINGLLGGHAITVEGVSRFITRSDAKEKEWHICELGCGGGDNMRAIGEWGRKNNIQIRFTGIDINPHCIAVAESAGLPYPAGFIASDYKDAVFDDPPDILFSSLFCHHFSNAQLIFMMRWMSDNAKAGFFINDLHRHALAYYSIKLLTRLFSRSYLVKNDAPLSVARGFRRTEIDALMRQAGLRSYQIRWKWAFRWLVVYKQ